MRAIITGASSGIGAALARELSRRGWSLALLARRAELLDQLVSELKTKAVALPADVTDRDAVRDAVRRGAESLGGDFDLAVANAGISVPTWSTKFNLDDAERIVRIASIAGLRGLPSASVYSASKAAMQAFLEASRVELAQRGVGVTIVNPGWVETPIIDKYKGPVPFLMKADKAARLIADGIERGAREVEFPWQISLLVRTLRLMPNALYDRLLRPYARRKIDPEKVRR